MEINTKKEYALKIIDKSKINDYLIQFIRREIKIVNESKCENIVEIYEVMETRESYILVLELCEIDLEKYLKENP